MLLIRWFEGRSRIVYRCRIMSDIVKRDETILPVLMEKVEDKIAVIRMLR